MTSRALFFLGMALILSGCGGGGSGGNSGAPSIEMKSEFDQSTNLFLAVNKDRDEFRLPPDMMYFPVIAEMRSLNGASGISTFPTHFKLLDKDGIEYQISLATFEPGVEDDCAELTAEVQPNDSRFCAQVFEVPRSFIPGHLTYNNQTWQAESLIDCRRNTSICKG